MNPQETTIVEEGIVICYGNNNNDNTASNNNICMGFIHKVGIIWRQAGRPNHMNSIIFESDAARGEYARTGYVTCSYAAAGEAKEGQCGRRQDDAQGRVPHFPSGVRLPKDAVLVWQQYSNVYDKYQFDQRILGKGLHGSVRQCIDRSTGERYAVKSIRKDNPKVKPQRLLREVSLLQLSRLW